jgi:hypothetical protein
MGPSACFESSPHSGHYTYTNDQAPITDVDKMLFTRHVTISTSISRLMDYIADDITDNECFHFPVWKYVDDECEETKRFVRSQNWIINLYNHEFVMHFVVSWQAVCLVVAVVNVDVLETNPSRPCRENLHAQL